MKLNDCHSKSQLPILGVSDSTKIKTPESESWVTWGTDCRINKCGLVYRISGERK